MSQRLVHTVVVGGVLYSAGTAASKELKALISNPVHWSGSEPVGPVNDPPVPQFPEPEPPAEPVEESSYDDQTIEVLKDEIRKRNEGRDADAKLPLTGNKAELVAVLESDDKS